MGLESLRNDRIRVLVEQMQPSTDPTGRTDAPGPLDLPPNGIRPSWLMYRNLSLLQSGLPSESLDLMAAFPGADLADVAVLDGGPMDGREHPDDWDTEQLCVIMTDGQQHRYVRTDRIEVLPDGRSAVVFAYRGRYYGPK